MNEGLFLVMFAVLLLIVFIPDDFDEKQADMEKRDDNSVENDSNYYMEED